MKIFHDSFLRFFGLQNRPLKPTGGKQNFVTGKRSPGFDAASSSRLFSDWDWTILTFDELIRRALRKMRSRARDLEINNDYVKRFISHMVYNVIGHQGIHFQPRCKNGKGEIDKTVNETLKEAWKDWGTEENCTVTEDMDWHEVQALIVRTLVRDGECLLRLVSGYKNEFRFAVQVIIPDSLDEQYTMLQSRDNKNRVICGVEFNDNRKPINYYLRKGYEFQQFYYPEFSGIGAHEVIPRDEIIHLFLRYRGDQTRGVPWIHAAQTRLKMIGAYEEAALVNARVGASKMGWWEREAGEDPEQAGLAQGDAAGNLSMSAEPGTFEVAPIGYKLSKFEPGYPDGEFPNFEKAILRGIAAGLDISYTGLSNDLENVNYSSMRGGVLEEREVFKFVQRMVATKVHQRVYKKWLLMSLLNGNLPSLDMANYNEYVKGAKWHGRRWDWVDPKNEIEAVSQELELGLTSKTRIMAERKGYEFDEVCEELASEIQIAEGMDLPSAKIPWEAQPNPNAPSKPLQPTADGDASEPPANSGDQMGGKPAKPKK